MDQHGQLHVETLAIHADSAVNDYKHSIAPPIHLSTIFDLGDKGDGKLTYSREDTHLRQRAEALIGALEGGFALLYSSGQSAAYAAFRYFKPKRIFMTKGYHGTRQITDIMQSEGAKVLNYEEALNVKDLNSSDLVFLETPRNPTLELLDIAAYSERTKKCGAILMVDGTLAPPVLQKPLSHGADIVYHSCTKYLGGHSDLLAGALVVSRKQVWEGLRRERTVLGSVPGSLETWLLVRSLRTLPLRMQAHSKNASAVAAFLSEQTDILEYVFHTSLSARLSPTNRPMESQMSLHTGVVTIIFRNPLHAKRLASHLHLFRNATSLGAVESLVDHRARWDPTVHPGLVRFSVGCENANDLVADLEQALNTLRNTPTSAL